MPDNEKKHCMKKLMTALAALCAAGSLFAATETVDGIEWTWQVSDGEAEALA